MKVAECYPVIYFVTKFWEVLPSKNVMSFDSTVAIRVCDFAFVVVSFPNTFPPLFILWVVEVPIMPTDNFRSVRNPIIAIRTALLGKLPTLSF